MSSKANPKIFGLPSSMNHKVKVSTNNKAPAYSSEEGYFDSYSHFGIHEEMLKDSVRTESYKNAILLNKDNFKDKIVLDIGSGTGILSLFSAQAGAKHVYAIEMAEIANFSKEIIKRNNYEDKITVIKGKVEEISLPVAQVDIIISEWMGYFLLFESMLDSVLFARDKWLKPGGIIMPDKATLYICGIEDFQYKNEKIHFWDNVYGFDMSPLKNESLKEPLIDVVEKDSVVTSSFPILSLNLYTATPKDLVFERRFQLKVIKKNFLHAFVCYFDVSFDSVDKRVWFSTGPFHPMTHWKQTVLYTDEDYMLSTEGVVNGKIKVRRNSANHRETDIFVMSSYKERSKASESAGKSQKRWYFLR